MLSGDTYKGKNGRMHGDKLKCKQTTFDLFVSLGNKPFTNSEAQCLEYNWNIANYYLDDNNVFVLSLISAHFIKSRREVTTAVID